MNSDIHLARSRESTLFELAVAVLLLLSLLPCLFCDDKEGVVSVIFATLGCALACTLLLVCAYTPSSDLVHLAFVHIKNDNLIQLLLAARLLRVLSLEVAVGILLINFSTLIPDEPTQEAFIGIAAVFLVAILFLTLFFYGRRIRKASEIES